jgi:hypothetical protein
VRLCVAYGYFSYSQEPKERMEGATTSDEHQEQKVLIREMKETRRVYEDSEMFVRTWIYKTNVRPCLCPCCNRTVRHANRSTSRNTGDVASNFVRNTMLN